MNVLVAEYFTGGGLCGDSAHRVLPSAPLPRALCREGDLMLRVLLRDLVQVEGVRVTTTRDVRLYSSLPESVEVHTVATDERWTPQLRALLEEADAFWPIAPERDGVLAELCELGEHSGCLLLNSSSAAVRVAASKYATASALRRAGLPCVETWYAEDIPNRVSDVKAVVLKPDDGVGCEGVRRVEAAQAQALMRDGEVAQPYVEGQAVSLSILYGAGEHRLVGLNLQEVACRGSEFVLKACVVNGVRERVSEPDAMAKAIGQAIPGLAGYVGVDCVLHDHALCILEVNPRLTTSYAGLSLSLGINAAAWAIGLLAQGTLIPSSVPQADIASAGTVRVAL